MHHRTKTILALVAAAGLLALAVGGASARSFSFSEKNFELIWNNALTGKTKFIFGWGSLGNHIECNVTLLGRYPANTIAKNTGVNQGTINHSEVEGCVGGSATLRTETMPWNLRYRSFEGRLPAISFIAIGLIGMSFRLREAGGFGCTSFTEPNEPFVLIVEGTSLENIRAEERNGIIFEGSLCALASPGRFAGRGLIQNLPRTANIAITLI